MLPFRRLNRYRKHVIFLVVASFVFGIITSIYIVTETGRDKSLENSIFLQKIAHNKNNNLDSDVHPGGNHDNQRKVDPIQAETSKLQGHQHDQAVAMVTDNKDDIPVDADGFPKPNYNLHAFYYIWYASPGTDGKYLHWNHEYLPHWDPKIAGSWPTGRHVPPEDIGANFYPYLGAYSSKDHEVIEDHMKQIRSAGIGTLAVSWYPPNQADGQGEEVDPVIPIVLDIANKYNVKVCLHIEPYDNRNAENLRSNVQYVMSQYGTHPAFYRRDHHGKSLPLFYVYDSYLVDPQEWSNILTPDGAMTVRGTDLDAIYIGLLVEGKHRQQLVRAGFDGFYTYFASTGFTYGSRLSNWPALAKEAESKDMLFIPSVGPGYIDTRVRPWNSVNTKERDGGQYYEKMFSAAVDTNPPIISITSFNEWHEGTQIEKSVPKQIKKFKYLDYVPNGVDFYLTLTRKWALKYKRLKRN